MVTASVFEPAWRAFDAATRRRPGAIGVWQETFVLLPGRHESVYSDMPVLGLAAATTSVPVTGVTGATDRAEQRFSSPGAARRSVGTPPG